MRWRRVSVVALCVLLLLFAGVALYALRKPKPSHPPPLPPVSGVQPLVVLIRNDATTFYRDANEQYAGLEYDLVNLFAEEIGVKVQFKVIGRYTEIVPQLMHNAVHFAAAGVTSELPDAEGLQFGPVYQTVTPVIVYNRLSKKVNSLNDLVGRTVKVVAGSNGQSLLTHWNARIRELRWKTVENDSNEGLIEAVAQGALSATVADSHLVYNLRRFYPNLEIGPALDNPRGLVWMFPPDADPHLLAKVNAFFARIKSNGTLKRLLDRYYGHLERLQPVDVAAFLAQRLTILPRYRSLFQQAEARTGIDWRLLAALSYQESHWDPFAVSSMGVRGLMMLTNDTADRMGVTDRSDAMQNIMAGARYIRLLQDSIPDQVGEPDHTWMALASYNSGLGHIQDARILARDQKLDPNAWTDMKTTLLQLRNPAYFPKTKHGYARGGETVIFVESVRTYFDILSRMEHSNLTLEDVASDAPVVSSLSLQPLSAQRLSLKPLAASPSFMSIPRSPVNIGVRPKKIEPTPALEADPIVFTPPPPPVLESVDSE